MAIKVECIQASRDLLTGKCVYTLICQYPRAIHAQALTHRLFSRNSSSTRAIPVATAIDQIINNPAEYLWTINQSGMQGELAAPEKTAEFEVEYLTAMGNAIKSVKSLADMGAHKQNAGRLLEPFQNIKIVLTATEWENWDWLRDDEDAQGEIAELARAIRKARDEAEVMDIHPGEWHVPFVDRHRAEDGTMKYSIEGTELTEQDALDVSASVCAQVSYRKSDFSLEKARKIKGMLINGRRVHASPFEHQCLCYKAPNNPYSPAEWEKGISHVDRNGVLWSGNIAQFIQHRQRIPGHDRAKPETP